MLGERTLVTKGGCFTAGVTLSHIRDPFNTMIPVPAPGHVFGGAKPLFKGTGFYHITQPYSRYAVKIGTGKNINQISEVF
jgi:hypothetical protein